MKWGDVWWGFYKDVKVSYRVYTSARTLTKTDPCNGPWTHLEGQEVGKVEDDPSGPHKGKSDIESWTSGVPRS